MQYVSPFSLFPPDSGLSFNPAALVMAKHRLMAEFELQGTSTIKIKGKDLSRNDVLKLFDQLKASKDIAFHALVASDPVLLNFLERAEIRYTSDFSVPANKITPEFTAWISPYFSESFKKCILKSFRRQNSAEFLWLADIPGQWMNKSDQNKAWKGIETELDNMRAKLFEINNAKIHDTGQGSVYANEALLRILSVLPEQFGTLINKYAWQIMRYATREFNNNSTAWAMKIIGYAKSLATDGETQEAILKTEQEMNLLMQGNRARANNTNAATYTSPTARTNNNNSNGLVSFLIIFGTLIGLVLAFSNHSGNSNQNSYLDNYEAVRLTDSMIKAARADHLALYVASGDDSLSGICTNEAINGYYKLTKRVGINNYDTIADTDRNIQINTETIVFREKKSILCFGTIFNNNIGPNNFEYILKDLNGHLKCFIKFGKGYKTMILDIYGDGTSKDKLEEDVYKRCKEPKPES